MKSVLLVTAALALSVLALGAQAQKPANANQAGKMGHGGKGVPLSKAMQDAKGKKPVKGGHHATGKKPTTMPGKKAGTQ